MILLKDGKIEIRWVILLQHLQHNATQARLSGEIFNYLLSR